VPHRFCPFSRKKEKQPVSRLLIVMVLNSLEADLWSCGYAQVVMGAVVEVHLIANVHAQADRSGKGLDANARIEDAERPEVGDAADGTNEAGDRPVIGSVEVQEASLQGPEYAPRAGPGDDLRSEQTGQAAQPSAVEAGEAAGVGRGGCVALEVVSHLRFELEVTTHVEVEVGPDAERVQVVEIRQAKIVRLHTELTMVIRAALVIPLRDGRSARILRGRRACRRGGLRRGARRGCSRGSGLLRLVARGGRLASGGRLATSGRRLTARRGSGCRGRALAATRLSCVLRQQSDRTGQCQYK
jgi:hypothetical protein